MPHRTRSEIFPGLELSWTSAEDIWLHFKSPKGFLCAINVNELDGKFPPTVVKAIQGWANSAIVRIYASPHG